MQCQCQTTKLAEIFQNLTQLATSLQLYTGFARSVKHTAQFLPHRLLVALQVNLCNSLFQLAYILQSEFWED